MSNRLSAEPQPWGRAEFFETGYTRVLTAQKDMWVTAIRRSQVNEFVDVVQNSSLADDSSRHQRGKHTADGQPVRTRCSINVVCGFPTSAAGHVLDHDCRISWDVLAQKRYNRSYAQVCRAAGIGSRYHTDGLILIKGSLSDRDTHEKNPNQQQHN